MLPHVTNLVAKAANPTIVAILARNGYSLLGSRRFFTCLGFTLAAMALMPVYPLHTSSGIPCLPLSPTISHQVPTVPH